MTQQAFNVWAALAARFCAPEWAALYEVRNATGFGAQRSADLVAMGLWPSRGLEIHGVEVKVSRGDWLREKKDPEKAEAVSAYCDRWWLAVSDPKIVADGELPPGWGLLVPNGKGLRAVVDAPLRQNVQPLDRSFVAAMLRRASEGMVPADKVREIADAQIKEACERADATAKTHFDRESRFLRERVERSESAIRDFEKASGLCIREYGAGDIGKAVAMLRGHGAAPSFVAAVERVRDEVTECAARLANAAEAMREAEAAKPTESASEAAA